MTEYVWHYTTGECFKMICESGVLRPAVTGIEKRERPAVWFSSNQEWEETASKGFIDPSGVRRTATKDEMISLAGGLVRLGITPDRAIPYFKIQDSARIPKRVWRSLIKAGKNSGASVREWFAVIGEIPLENIDVIDVMNERGEWERVRYE